MKLFSIKHLMRGQRGFTLTEVVIAMGVFGMIGAAVMGALDISNTSILSANEKTVAESLTRTAIEYVKQRPYDTDIPPAYDSDVEDYNVLLGLDDAPYYGDYTVNIIIDYPDPEADGSSDDDGIQKIKAEIRYLGKLALVTEDYKVNR